MMSFKFKVTAFLLAFGASGSAFAADAIPYPTPGAPNPVWLKFRATTDGPISAYYLGSHTTLEENIGVTVNGQWIGPGLSTPSNRSLKVGQRLDFGTVRAGDTVAVFLAIPSLNVGVYSQKTLIEGGPANANGIYSTPFSGSPGASIPPGTFIGFEDESYRWSGADFDYNDSEYVFTNLTAVIDN